MRKQLVFGLAVAAVCLYFAFRGISFQELGLALRAAHFRWIGLALIVYTVGYLLRAWRWEILIRPIRAVPAKQLFGPLVLGFFANNILPFRMGELVRAHITGQKFNISRTASLGTILLERLCDALSFLSTFVVAALCFPFPKEAKMGAAVMALGCLAITVGIWWTIGYQHRLRNFLEWTSLPTRWKKRLVHLVENFVNGVSGLHDISYVVESMSLSLVIWTLEGTVIYLIAHAFATHLSYPQSFFLLFFMGLSVTLPQAPGYVGTVELFGIGALALLGIRRELALPIILTIHGTQFAYIVVLGCWALWFEGLTFKNISSVTSERSV